MACDLATIQEQACLSGIGKVTDEKTLLRLIAQLTCEVAESAGGAEWGLITGDINDQSDLMVLFNQRARRLHFASGTDSSVAGTAGYEVLKSFTIPGGSLGPNGWIEVNSFWTLTSNANNKQIRFVLGGSNIYEVQVINLASFICNCRSFNRNSESAQIVNPNGTQTMIGPTSIAFSTRTVNTAVDQTLTIEALKASAGDVAQVRAVSVDVNYVS